MGLFATGVAVVSIRVDAEILGMTANSVTSVSLTPPLVLVCIDLRARIAPHMTVGRAFAINFLRDDQEVLSRYYAGGWREHPQPEHRFAAWNGAPRLVGALASVRCDVYRVDDGGDHHIVIGRALELMEGSPPWTPLLFFAGRYRRLAALDAVTAPPERLGPDGISIYYEEWSAADRRPAGAGDGPA
jgi:flavin reductase (DIM6/NTAB) family NADH-FMN oxidoreductase RutF